MVGITPYSSNSNVRAASNQSTNSTNSSGKAAASYPAESRSSTHSSMSLLSRQLSSVANSSEQREVSLAPSALLEKKNSLLAQLTGDEYASNKGRYDLESLKIDDAEHLERAQQATDFTNGKGSNPFKGMPGDQLSLIAYDDSGTFTTNERRAAFVESNEPALQKTLAGQDQSSPISSSAGREDKAGQNLMISRLFGGNEPGVANGSQGMSASNISRSPYEFLTSDDRSLLSSMYSYASEQGADLTYVDRLASELGEYRQHANGSLSSNFNDGTNFDVEGRQLTVSFNEKDSATASRILSGSAINTTAIDEGFLRHILDPGYGALTNTSDLGFLEKMVNQSSSEASAGQTLAPQFSSYAPILSIKDNVVLQSSAERKLPAFEPDIINDNGVWKVTEQGLAAGITLEGSRASDADLASGRATQNRYILDAFFGGVKDNQPEAPSWLATLVNRFSG